MSKEPIEQVQEILLRGKRKRARKEEQERDAFVVHQYFLKITGPLIEAMLSEFEYSQNQKDRRIAAHELVAYFDWCWREDFTDVPEGISLDSYIVRFARIVVSRMVQGNEGETSRLEGDYIVPTWLSPNVVFGWDQPARRPRKDTLIRNCAIVAFREKLIRSGVSRGKAVIRASQKFGLAPTTIRTICSKNKTEGTLYEVLRHSSDRELDQLVGYFMETEGE